MPLTFHVNDGANQRPYGTGRELAVAELRIHNEQTAQAGGQAIRRALIVDDSRLQRRILASLMKKHGFEIMQAESGEEALEICASFRPDLVMSDWMMPGMTGLEFCKKFREMPTDSYGYFILLTSKSEKDDIAQGLDAGADDFLTKPVNADELRARISAGERIVSMQKELSAKNELIADALCEIQKLYDSIDQDLIQAKKIQESLVPELTRDFGASRVSLLLKPCGHIGGDLVGMFSPSPGQLGFYSIDVSGHGITSAMMTARLGSYLSSAYLDQNLAISRCADHTYSLLPPEQVAAIMNDRLLADTGIEEYFTMAYCTIDLRSGALNFVQSGHPHPLLIRKCGALEYVGEGGLPIGLIPDIPFEQVSLQLEPGDKLLLYSDGFTECMLKNGEMLEPEGLERLVQSCPPGQEGQEFLDDLFWRLTQEMAPGEGLDDDVSAALFEYQGL